MKRSLLGIARNFNQANTLVRRLQEVGFASGEISILAPEVDGESRIGGALYFLAGVGPLSVPGLGPLIAAGPMKDALSRITLREMNGGLVTVGVPEVEAAVYAEKLSQGNYLISVSADENRDLERARETFRNSGAEDLSVADQKTIATASSPTGQSISEKED